MPTPIVKVGSLRRLPKFGANDQPCIVCDRPIRTARLATTKMIRMDTSNRAITDEEAAADPENDQGFHYIGADCLRNQPALKPYARSL